MSKQDAHISEFINQWLQTPKGERKRLNDIRMSASGADFSSLQSTKEHINHKREKKHKVCRKRMGSLIYSKWLGLNINQKILYQYLSSYKLKPKLSLSI